MAKSKEPIKENEKKIQQQTSPSAGVEKKSSSYFPMFPQKMIIALAEEVAKRLPQVISRSKKRKIVRNKKMEGAYFLDTSAIIDGRIFDVIELGFFKDTFVVPEEILLELKHIADSSDPVKKERGRKGLSQLDGLKKSKHIKLLIFVKQNKDPEELKKEVDEHLITQAKIQKGRIITCDYNLEKKASIQGISVINVNALAQALKVRAVPGENLKVKLLHAGKDSSQGVGYLDDGTMIVVEKSSDLVGKEVDVMISRVIQTAAGRILFAKKI